MNKRIIVSQDKPLETKLWQIVFTSLNWQHINVPLKLVSIREKIYEFSPDLLLLDMNSRQINPYFFCREAQREFPDLSIILINTKSEFEFEAQSNWAKSQGARAVIPSLNSSSTEINNILQTIFSVLNCQGDLKEQIINDLLVEIKINKSEKSLKSKTSKKLIEASRENPSNNRKENTQENKTLKYRGREIVKQKRKKLIISGEKLEQRKKRLKYRGSSY